MYKKKVNQAWDWYTFCWFATVNYNNVAEASAKFHQNHRK